MEDSIINVLANDNFIVVNRSLIKILGLKETIILGELASEYNYYKKNELLDEDGYFYSTIENIEESTSLSAYEQKKCLDNLSQYNIINVVLKGIPAKRHIKLNTLSIINLFTNHLETSFQKIKKLDCEKLGTNNNNIKNNNKNNNIFKKPTLEEVKQYCLERNNNIDAEKFIDFYESKGWMVGKNKMKDWKACVRTWEKKNTKYVIQEKELPNWFDKEQDIHIITKQAEEEMKSLIEEMTQ